MAVAMQWPRRIWVAIDGLLDELTLPQVDAYTDVSRALSSLLPDRAGKNHSNIVVFAPFVTHSHST